MQGPWGVGRGWEERKTSQDELASPRHVQLNRLLHSGPKKVHELRGERGISAEAAPTELLGTLPCPSAAEGAPLDAAILGQHPGAWAPLWSPSACVRWLPPEVEGGRIQFPPKWQRQNGHRALREEEVGAEHYLKLRVSGDASALTLQGQP